MTTGLLNPAMKLLPAGQKILRFSVVALLLVANFVLVNKNISLRSEINHFTRQLDVLERKASLMEAEDGFVGEEMNLNFGSLKLPTNHDFRRTFRLLAFFSAKDCSSCLTEETLRWGEVHQMQKIPVLAVCVGSDSGDAVRYRSKYNPTFPVFYDHDKIFERIKAPRTPLVLLLDKRDNVILAQIAEAGNDAKRERFYFQISQFVSVNH